MILLGKISARHSSSDDETTINQDKNPIGNIGCKKEIILSKHESNMSIEGVRKKLPKSYLESRESEEVCYHFYSMLIFI